MIAIHANGSRIEIGDKKFPCGELLISLGEEVSWIEQASAVYVDFVWEGNDDLIALLMVNDALRRVNPGAELFLTIGYFPYSRQDRIANVGESLSLKLVCNLINSCKFTDVVVLDPHSDVLPALLDNCRVNDLADIFMHLNVSLRTNGFDALVAPDAGASKKVVKLVKELGVGMIQAGKVRDTKTGQLSGFEVYAGALTGLSVMVVDDICDGGGTFIGLAEKLREKGAEEVLLYVTHGMFTKGVDILLEHYDDILTHSYYGKDDSVYDKIKVLGDLR